MLQSLLNSGYQTLNNIPRESFCLTIQIIAGPIGHPKMLHHLHCSKNVCSPSSFQIWHVNNNILILSNSLHDSKNSCSIRPFQELWVISANSITAGQLHHFRKGGYPTPVHLLWVMIKTPRMLGPLYHSIFSWLLLFQKCTLPTTFKAQWAGSPIPFKEPWTVGHLCYFMNCGSLMLFQELRVLPLASWRLTGSSHHSHNGRSPTTLQGKPVAYTIEWRVPYAIPNMVDHLHFIKNCRSTMPIKILQVTSTIPKMVVHLCHSKKGTIPRTIGHLHHSRNGRSLELFQRHCKTTRSLRKAGS